MISCPCVTYCTRHLSSIGSSRFMIFFNCRIDKTGREFRTWKFCQNAKFKKKSKFFGKKQKVWSFPKKNSTICFFFEFLSSNWDILLNIPGRIRRRSQRCPYKILRTVCLVYKGGASLALPPALASHYRYFHQRLPLSMCDYGHYHNNARSLRTVLIGRTAAGVCRGAVIAGHELLKKNCLGNNFRKTPKSSPKKLNIPLTN
jgi:hypothetical protein